MAIDTAEKRRSAAGLMFMPLPVVTPDSGKDAQWRIQAAGLYSGLITAGSDQSLTMQAPATIEASVPVATIANVPPHTLIAPTARIYVSVPVATISVGQSLTMIGPAIIEVSVPVATIGLQAPFTPTPISGEGKYPGTIEGQGKYV